MTDLEDISYYLGMQVDHVISEKISLYQSTYLKKIIDYFKMIKYKPVSILIDFRVANSLLLWNGNADKKTIN